MKIALAHDSFTQLGGAERVMEAFHEIFPEAPVFTLVLDKELKHNYASWDIRTSWLQVLYDFIPKLQYLLPFIPMAVSSLDFSGYDVVLSSSSSFIKNIKVPKKCIHINYCHTPTRFLWSEPEYAEQESPKIIRPLLKLYLGWLKKWDMSGAVRVNYFIANSKEVQNRILQYYNRPSEIIYPGINTGFWHQTAQKSDYFLIAGRLQAHKYNDLLIEVFNELGLPLHVVGSGRQESYLKSIAGPNITFYGRLNDEELRDQYSRAKAFLYPQVEDFGLMPLEAAACGTPTLAYGKGGALETVVPEVTGEFFKSYNKEEIKKTILSFKNEKYSKNKMIVQAEKFGKDNFKQTVFTYIKHLHENRS